jgi:hypothetical protein
VIAVLLGAAFILAISVGVLLLVALPHMRRGSRILTPQGERVVRRAKVKSSTAAAGAGRAATAVPAKIIEPLRGPKVKPARAPRSRRNLPPALGGPGPVVVRPDDTGGLRLTRDVAGPVAADGAGSPDDGPSPGARPFAAPAWGGQPARHVSGRVAYPAPKAAPRILSEARTAPAPEAEPVPEPAPEPVPEPVAEPVPEPVAAVREPEPGPVAEVLPEPEPEPAPAPEPEPEPAPEPVAEAVPAPEPEPVADVVREPGPEPAAREPEPAPASSPGPERPAAGIGRQRPSPAESGPIPTDAPVSKPPIKPAAKGGSKPRSKSTRGAPRGRAGGRGARQHGRPAPETRPVEVVDVRKDENPETPAPSEARNRSSS